MLCKTITDLQSQTIFFGYPKLSLFELGENKNAAMGP